MVAIVRTDVLPSLPKPRVRRKPWSAYYPPKSLLPLLPSVRILFAFFFKRPALEFCVFGDAGRGRAMTQNAKLQSERPKSERRRSEHASSIVIARIVVEAIVIPLIVVAVIHLVLAAARY